MIIIETSEEKLQTNGWEPKNDYGDYKKNVSDDVYVELYQTPSFKNKYYVEHTVDYPDDLILIANELKKLEIKPDDKHGKH